MEKFMLLVRQDIEKLRELPDAEFQDCVRCMMLWVGELGEAGKYIAAEPLATVGRYVTQNQVLSDGPFIEAKEAISGFFIIEAENLEKATAFAQRCPQVQNNTSVVEVRPILSLDQD
jgi:hypothetical protein